MIDQNYPLQSLREGHWFKLICGASFQHLPAVRNLALAYTLAGADCIDVAAEPAVVLAAKEAIAVAVELQQNYSQSASVKQPFLMVSLNDGEDPHFRKAEFDPVACPSDCSRPCEAICPAKAISLSGVTPERCYGCGRCLPVCPIQHITTRSQISTPQAIAPLVLEAGVDAVEIHTQVGHLQDFQKLWNAIQPWANHLKLLAISCPDGEGVLDYLQSLYTLISPLSCPLVWQTDGRPMSGDIGTGATRAAIKLGQKVLAAGLPGYVQLAGGTNDYTVPKLKLLGLLKVQPLFQPATKALDWQNSTSAIVSSSPTHIAGVAYGSYARVLLSTVLEQLEAVEISESAIDPSYIHLSQQLTNSVQKTVLAAQLETAPDLLRQAVTLAHSLVSQLKPFQAMPSLNSSYASSHT